MEEKLDQVLTFTSCVIFDNNRSVQQRPSAQVGRNGPRTLAFIKINRLYRRHKSSLRRTSACEPRS